VDTQVVSNGGGGGGGGNHKKHRHHHRGNNQYRQYNPFNNPFNNPFRQYSGNNNQYEGTSGTNSVNSQQYEGTSGNGGAFASSGPGGAEASTPGAVAQSGVNPDQQYPVTGPQGNVVNEVPTQGPLPNTGGLSFLAITLPVMGFLILCFAVIYRIKESLRENR
jgi:hypothetical protein